MICFILWKKALLFTVKVCLIVRENGFRQQRVWDALISLTKFLKYGKLFKAEGNYEN